MVKTIVVWLFALLFLFCSCQHPAGNRAMVNGNLADATGLKLTLQEMDTREIHSIDSVLPDRSGKFTFNPVIKESGFWLIKAATGKILVLLLNAGDQVELTGSTRDFPDNVIVKGTKETMLLNDFFRFTRINEREVDSLEMLLIDRQDSAGYFELTQKLDTSFRQIWERQRTFEMAFINKNPGSLASLVVLSYAFGMAPVLSPEDDFAYYLKLDSALFQAFPENKHVKYHHQRVLEYKRKASLKSSSNIIAPHQTQHK